MQKFDKKIRKIKSFLPKALVGDRMAAAREISRLTRRKAKPLPADKMRARLDRLETRLQASAARRTRRQQNRPTFSYNEDLPITAKKDAIIRAIRRHPVIIVSGETGSGKTTQLPKFCLAAGRGMSLCPGWRAWGLCRLNAVQCLAKRVTAHLRFRLLVESLTRDVVRNSLH